jgi:hypothetical protein
VTAQAVHFGTVCRSFSPTKTEIISPTFNTIGTTV